MPCVLYTDLTFASPSAQVSFNDLSGMGDGKVTMAECLGVKGFESAVSHAQRNIAFTKQIEAGLQSMMSVQEEEIKLMKRWMASYARKQTSTMLTFPVHDGYSLVTAFHALAKVVQELMKFWGATHDGFQKFERGLHSLRTELKQAVKNHVKRHEQELKMHETARREKDAAVKDLAKAVAEEKRAMAAHTEAQRAADRGAPVKKGIFRGWGKEDVHKLKAKMDKAIREKNKCDDALKRKSQALEKASENLSQRTREQLEQMQTTEKKRFDCVTQLTLAFTEDRTKRLNHLVNVVSSAYLSAENTDINDNILRFIKQKQVRAKFFCQFWHSEFLKKCFLFLIWLVLFGWLDQPKPRRGVHLRDTARARHCTRATTCHLHPAPAPFLLFHRWTTSCPTMSLTTTSAASGTYFMPRRRRRAMSRASCGFRFLLCRIRRRETTTLSNVCL